MPRMSRATRMRIAAEERWNKNPTKRNFDSYSKWSRAEMDEVLAAFDARNSNA